MLWQFGREHLSMSKNYADPAAYHAGKRPFRSISISWSLALSAVILTLSLGMLVRWAEEPYYDKDRADPSYAYLANALAVEQGSVPFLIQHPGTTIEELGAAVIKIKWWLSYRQDSISSIPMVSRVLSKPETYIYIINDVLLAIMAVTIGMATKWVYDYTGRALLAVVVPSLLLFSPSALESTGQVQPEPLLVALAILVTILAAPSRTRVNDPLYRRPLLFGIVLGAGLVTKVTFIPLSILICAFSGFSSIIVLLISCLFTMGLVLFPIWSKILLAYGWFQSIATHKGFYGGGDEGVPSLTNLLASAVDCVLSEPLIVLAIVLAGAASYYVHVSKNRSRNPAWQTFYVSAMSAAIVQLVIVAKHPSPRYLLPALAGAAVWIPLAVSHIERQTRIDPRFVASVVVLLLLVAADWDARRYLRSLNNRNQLAEIQLISRILKCKIIPYYRYSSKEYALYFADYWSGGIFSSQLSKIYPEETIFNPSTGLIDKFALPSSTISMAGFDKWCLVGDYEPKLIKFPDAKTSLIAKIGDNSLFLVQTSQ